MADLTPDRIARPSVGGDRGIVVRPSRVALPQVRDPRGRALSGLAGAQEKFGVDMAAISNVAGALLQERQQAADRSFLDTYKLEYTKRASVIQAEALSDPKAGEDVVSKLDERLAKAQAETLEAMRGKYSSISDRAAQGAESIALGVRTSSSRAATQHWHNAKIAALVEQQRSNVLDTARIAGKDGRIDEALSNIKESTDALSGVLSVSKRRAFAESARALVLEMAIEGHIRRGEAGEAQKLIDRFSGFAGPEADETVRTTVDAAKESGVDPALMLAVEGAKPKDAEAAAENLAGTIEALKRGLKGEPTPAEVYIAGKVGIDKTIALAMAQPDAKISEILTAPERQRSGLPGETVRDFKKSAVEVMQKRMSAVADQGLLEGRKIKADEAQVPIDAVMKLNRRVAAFRRQQIVHQQKILKRRAQMIDPAKDRSKTDPVQAVLEKSPEALVTLQEAFDAVDESGVSDETRQLMKAAVDQNLEEQTALGVRANRQKIFPNRFAQIIVKKLTEAKSPTEITQNFLRLQQSLGGHWNRAFRDLVDAGLPADFQVLAMTSNNPADTDLVASVVNDKLNDLTKDLGTSVNAKVDILDVVEDNAADFLQAFETGPLSPAAVGQGRAITKVLQKVAMKHFRTHRDTAAAVKAASNILDARINVVTSSNIRALVPAEQGLTDGQVENAVEMLHTKEKIEAFDPVPVGALRPTQSFLERDRTIRTAVNSGIWITNPDGDGVVLALPIGETGILLPIRNKTGDFYELKYDKMHDLLDRSSREGLRRGQAQDPGVAS